MRKRTAGAIVQQRETWQGLTLTATDQEITDVKTYSGYSLDELKEMFDKHPYGVALDNTLGYLFNLNFPFTGRRKIGLVIRGQLEEMLPFPVEDLVVDFQELGTDGAVLAAAAPRSILGDSNGKKRMHHVTLQSLATLHALKRFNLIPQEDVVLDLQDTAVIMAFKGRRLVHLRHFFRSPQWGVTISALRDIVEKIDFTGARYLMVGDEDSPDGKEIIESALGITIELLTLDSYVKGEDLASWTWAGLGAALIALNPKGKINLSGERYRVSSGPSSRIALYVSSGLAGLSLLVLGLSSLDLYLKQRTYDLLSGEPNRIYRTVFPKAPPVKDVAKTFEERVRKLDKEQGTATENGANILTLLDEISRSIDPQVDVRMNEFVADDKEFTLAGTTVSFASVDKIKAALQRIAGASSVEIQSVDLASVGQVRFRFKGKL